LRIHADHAIRPPPIGEQLDDLGAVGEHGAEALSLAQHGEYQPGVVGLAVVEQVGLLRTARGQRRDQLRRLVARNRAVSVWSPIVVLALLDEGPGSRRPLARLTL